MTRASLYLSQDRHGIYHFRARVPASLRQHFNNKSEIKRTLRTDSRREAVRLARAYRVELDKMIEELTAEEAREALGRLRAISPFACARVIEAERPIVHDDGTTETISAKIVREGMGPGEDSVKLRKEMLEQLREEGRDKIDQKREAELHKAKLAAIASATAAPEPQHQPTPPTPTGPLLSEAISRYAQEKTKLDHWKGRTAIQNETTLRDLLEIVGDKPVKEITRQTITDFAAKFGKLPANRNKKVEFKGRPIAEVLEMEGYDSIEPATLRNNLIRVSSFFKWAKQNNLLDKNPAEDIMKLLPKKVRRKSKLDARDPFTTDELQKLFHADEFRKPKRPYRYWMPVIGLFSGARLEEICKLSLADIKRVGEVWYFDIADAKTDAGWRQTPIHDKLIDLGLLDYVERLRAEGHTRLFPELKPNKFGEVGASASKWFARYRSRCGIGEDDGKKCFHSFRHTVADHLKQRFTPPEAIHGILGHEDKVAHGTYGKRYQAASLKPYMDKIEFDVSIRKLDWKIWR
jgi:integrase